MLEDCKDAVIETHKKYKTKKLPDMTGTDQELQEVVRSDNSRANVRCTFDKVIDMVLLDFVMGKTELYRKLTEPKVNKLFKSKWFDEFYQACE